MDAEERMKRERREEELVSVEGRKRWVSASVSDVQGVSDEPHVFEGDVLSSPSEINICASRKNSLSEWRLMYDASFVISIPSSKHSIPPSPPNVSAMIESGRESDCIVDTSPHMMNTSGAFQAAFDENVSEWKESVSVLREEEGI